MLVYGTVVIYLPLGCSPVVIPVGLIAVVPTVLKKCVFYTCAQLRFFTVVVVIVANWKLVNNSNISRTVYATTLMIAIVNTNSIGSSREIVVALFHSE